MYYRINPIESKKNAIIVKGGSVMKHNTAFMHTYRITGKYQ